MYRILSIGTILVWLWSMEMIWAQDVVIPSGSSDVIIRNVHTNIPRVTQTSHSSTLVTSNAHKNIVTPKVSSPSQSSETGSFISPAELEILERLSEYTTPRYTSIVTADTNKGLAYVWLASATFLFLLELLTGALYAASLGVASLVLVIYVFLSGDIGLGWVQWGLFVFVATTLRFLFPQWIHAYAEINDPNTYS